MEHGKIVVAFAASISSSQYSIEMQRSSNDSTQTFQYFYEHFTESTDF